MTNSQVTDQLPRDAARRAVAESNAPSRKLGVKEAAQHLNLAVSTLNKMRMSGAGPRYIALTRRRVAYDLLDLEAWVAERKRNHTSEQS
jgi:predicted DNA-binding transcriptional regulator AlpA